MAGCLPTSCAQAATIQDWLPAALRPHCPRLAFYPARYSAATTVPHPTVPLARLLGRHEVLLLEELERHFLVDDRPDLSAFGLRRRFPLVVSLLHTNVAAFGGLRHGAWFGPLARAGAALLARAVCHHSLSVVTSAPFLLDAGETVVGLNGVAAPFLAAGAAAVPGQGALLHRQADPGEGPAPCLPAAARRRCRRHRPLWSW